MFADDTTIPLPALYVDATDPAVTFTDGRVKAGRLWLDTSTGATGTLKKRNAANDGWDTLIDLDAAVAPHAEMHEDGGSGEIDVTGLSGVLAEPQVADKIKESSGPTVLTLGAVADGQILKRDGTDLIGADAVAPAAHASEHQNGGADEISVAGLSGVLADPQTPITEVVQDIVAAMVVGGTDIDVTYDDGANTLTFDSTAGGGGTSTVPDNYRFNAVHANPNATTLTATGGQSGNSSGTVASADDSDGVFQSRTTGSSINNSAGLEPATTFSMCRREWLPTTIFKIKTGASLANLRIMIGMFSADPSTNPMPIQHCAGFRYSTDVDGTAFWRTITNDGGAPTSGTVTTTTAAIAVSTAYVLKIVQSASDVKFYIDDVLVATHTTELPGLSNVNAPNVKVVTLEAVAKSMSFSHWKLWHK